MKERSCCARSALELKTYYAGKNQATHPNVISFEKPWHGYRYYMAYTTYPYGNGSEENPCLAASNDLIHWEKPEGLINPIACCEEVECDELKDTHLLYREDLDQLELWYLGRLNSTRSQGGPLYCFRKTSRNGVHWSRYEVMYCFDEIGLASPSVIYLEGRYHFWGIRHDFVDIGLYYMTSENGKEWSALEKCNIPMARETDMWHGAVCFWKDRYYYVWVGWAGKARNEIYLADSMDGKNWGGTRRILYNDAGWAYLYRPALLMEEETVYLYYGVVRHDGKWLIALSSGEDIDHLCGICPTEVENHVEYVSFTRRMMLKKSINQIKALIVPRILVQIPLLFVLQCLLKSVWVVWGISMILSAAAHYFLFYREKCLTGGIVMGTLCAASTTFVYQVMSEAIAWIKWLA